ncbi:MAG: hypothetical protein Kilf2KO_30270 [Rhodospirillales bacterium]
MSDSGEPQDIRNSEVLCSGPEEAPHEPRRLLLPAKGSVACPLCGRSYRRAPHWSGISTASWPKFDP